MVSDSNTSRASISATDDTISKSRMALTPEPKIESVDRACSIRRQQVLIRPSGLLRSFQPDRMWKLHIVA